MDFHKAVGGIVAELAKEETARDRIKAKVIIKGVNNKAPSDEQEVVVTSDNEKEALCKMVAKLTKNPKYQNTKFDGIWFSSKNIGVLCNYLWKNPRLRKIEYIDMVD